MSHQDDDHHDKGLGFDLRTILSRRATLIGLGLAGAGGYLSLRGVGDNANATGVSADGSVCVAAPGETAGPFPADGTNSRKGASVNALSQTGIVRKDMRPSFNGMTPVAEGVQLDLVLTVVNVNAACAPLAGYALYLWHCDAEGVYSLYGKTDRNYCRGVGITDAAGQVKFTTVFPGCYVGRWPHFHFEVFGNVASAFSGDNSLLTSQLALPGDVSQAVYAAAPVYSASAANLGGLGLASDMVFADNTADQLTAQTMVVAGDVSAGFRATATIGIAA